MSAPIKRLQQTGNTANELRKTDIVTAARGCSQIDDAETGGVTHSCGDSYVAYSSVTCGVPCVPWIVLRLTNWMTATRAFDTCSSLPRSMSSTYLCVRNVPGKWKQTVRGCGSGGDEKRTIARDMTPLLMPKCRIPFTVGLVSSSKLWIKTHSCCKQPVSLWQNEQNV